MYSVLVAADLFGTKLNYEIGFSSQPTLPDLTKRIEHVFVQEGGLRRPPGDPTVFAIQRLQVFDDKVELWVDLLSPTQITPMCQIYAFQPETQFHKEVQSKLPPAVKAPPISESSFMRAAPTPVPYTPMYVAPTPAAPVPTSSTPLVTYPADPSLGVTHEEKLRTVFEEIDSRKTGSALLADFNTLLSTLRIDVPSGITSGSFFGKDDLHPTITFPDFQNFSEKYPTLLDALFNRCKEFWVGVKQNEKLETAKVAMEDLKGREAEARMIGVQTTATTNAQEMKVAQAAAEVVQQEANERESEARMQSSRQECDRSAHEVSIRANEVQRSVDQTRQAEVAHHESIRGVEHSEGLLRAQELEIMRAEEKLRELERLMREQQNEVEAAHAAGQARRADLVASQTVEQSKAAGKLEAERLQAMQDEQLALAEASLVASQEREKEAAAYNHASREATMKVRAIKDAEERELLIVREREAAAKVAEAEVARSVEAQEGLIRTLEMECQDHTTQILRVQHEEQPLIDQELTLRAQRHNLEAQEARLRSEHNNFQMRNGTRGVQQAVLPAAAAASPVRDIPQPYYPPSRPPLL